jgi:hypothetical protein
MSPKPLTFGAGSGLVFVRSAYARAQAYFEALKVVVDGRAAVATKFGFPSKLVDKVYQLDVSYVLAAVRQADDKVAVLAFGPKKETEWPTLVLKPDGATYALATELDPLEFGVLPQLAGVTLGNASYFALDGAPYHDFDLSMLPPDHLVVSIDDTFVATASMDGLIIDVSTSLSEIVVSAENDPGAAIAAKIQETIVALKDSCAEFHNIGRIADYTDMLAQLQSASETINLNLAINPDLGSYSAELDAINVILGQISKTITDTVTIDDSQALQSILDFMIKLKSCKKAIQDFNIAITSVAVITIPKSLGDTSLALKNFNAEVKCIADHMKYFATGVYDTTLTEGLDQFVLSASRQAEIQAAISSVNALVSIGNADLHNIEAQAVKEFQQQANALASNVSAFGSVLSSLTTSLSLYLPPEAWRAAQAAVAASEAAARARAARV